MSSESKGIYCAEHKKDGMIDIKSKKCLDCNFSATFNYKDKKTGLYCSKHKKYGMIDIKAIRCNKCTKTANFGLPGNKSEYCFTHKENGMISDPRKKCKTKGCNEIALYGTTIASYCEKHKEDNMIDFVQKKCKSCSLLNILNKDNLCYYCSPDKTNTTKLAKQRMVQSYLDNNHFNYISTDKIIDDGFCGKERPDFIFESKSKSHFVIVEVDEYQHKHIPEECECTRMVNVSNSLGMPVIFLRFNPDSFKNSLGKSENPTFNSRIKILETCLRTNIDRNVDELLGFCTVKYLFYDAKFTDEYLVISEFEKEN